MKLHLIIWSNMGFFSNRQVMRHKFKFKTRPTSKWTFNLHFRFNIYLSGWVTLYWKLGWMSFCTTLWTSAGSGSSYRPVSCVSNSPRYTVMSFSLALQCTKLLNLLRFWCKFMDLLVNAMGCCSHKLLADEHAAALVAWYSDVGLPGKLAKVGFVAANYSLLELLNLRNSTF